MKVCIILGTRPEIIKMSPIIRECQKMGIDYFVLHTGQHYSYEMDKVFFENLNLPLPDFNLDVGSASHGAQTGRMLEKIEAILLKEKPSVVLVQGDTNTVAAGTLAATKIGIKVGHVEAGLRSYDRSMPEELNRILSDHLSDYLFVPTAEAKTNLIREGLDESKIYLTYNTITDSVYQNLDIAKNKSDILDKLKVSTKNYVLVTAHRQENVDVKDRLTGIIEGLKLIHDHFGMQIVFPIHPRTLKQINDFNIILPECVSAIDPVGFLDFLILEANARLIITDSGGLQEESCILKVPCVTLRDNTERPETLTVGSNLLASTDPHKILKCAITMAERLPEWNNPFGDGHAGEDILKIINGDI
ncbi:UDP-N-acetylglucosamine 2-epimerase (non-hydrolyzing) [Methanococcoides sp. SA1]|nr:UDP-N-acetylglucosamine 2-epimerase (non-hydrolyzing) [Methanococcoides sp. SA1]